MLFVSGEKLDENFSKAINNIPMHDILPVQGANVYDILRRETLVLTKDCVDSLCNRLSIKVNKKIKTDKLLKGTK